MSISMPFKEIAMKYLDLKDKSAKLSFNVNTVIIKKKIIGYNTDFMAIKNMKDFKNVKNIILVGAGGLAKSFFKSLKKKNFFIYNRSKNRILFFKKNSASQFTLNKKVAKNLKSYAVVNATPSLKKIKIYEFLDYNQAKFLMDCKITNERSFLEQIAKKYSIPYKNGNYLYKEQRKFQKKIYLDEKL